MSIRYDIQKDELYQEGLEKGLEKGVALEAKKQKEIQQKKTEQFIISLLKEGDLSVSKIASIFMVSESLVRKLKKSLND